MYIVYHLVGAKSFDPDTFLKQQLKVRCKVEEFIYGGDYNPDQWLDEPQVLEDDIRMMKKAHINEVSLGIFSWALLEPEEGRFEFDWLADIIHKLYENGIYTILATPSGARPRWLAKKYPEVLRTYEDGKKAKFGGRHNHCLTSPAYREKVRIIDAKLAECFKDDPAVIGWHISNEFSGECYCSHCQDEFRKFLKRKFGSIEKLNHEWWTTFWSHTYTSFDEIEPPSSIGENETNGLIIDWRRFATYACTDFIKNEIEAIRSAGAKQPVTTNMMYEFGGYDYAEFAKVIDTMSWDSYPEWGIAESDGKAALEHGLYHDMMRSFKDKPFLLMESCPSGTNWQSVSRLKRPGLLKLAGIHAVSHGADSVQYFQIRQGRGSSEKFHGAVIDHTGRDDTRVFKEVTETGALLKEIAEIKGAVGDAKVAIINDTQNKWALENSQGPRNCNEGYYETVHKIYEALKINAVDVDVIEESHSFDGYKILIAPMLYSLHDGAEKRIREFVENGGILISTYLCGVVNENDLCYMGDIPYDMTDVLGVRTEEIDALCDGMKNSLLPVEGASMRLQETDCEKMCELISLKGAECLMTYGSDFYKGSPALTVNQFGKGKAYYIASEPDREFYVGFLGRIIKEAGVVKLMESLPEECDIASRVKGGKRYVFIENFGREDKEVKLPEVADMLYGDTSSKLPATDAKIYSIKA